MKAKMKLQVAICVKIITITMSAFNVETFVAHAQSQPTSSIQSTGDGSAGKFAIPYLGSFPNTITLSTGEVPKPSCPNDRPDQGGPDYYWTLGSLDAMDNHDGIWGPNGLADPLETVTVKDDTAATQNVTVYCSQTFAPSGGGNDYTNSTLVSTGVQTTIQVPGGITFTNSSDGSGFSVPASDYNFTMQDQAPSGNPLGNVDVIVYENVGSISTTWSSSTGYIADGGTYNPISHGQAFPSSGTANSTGDNGSWFDYIHPAGGFTSTMDNYASSSLYGHVIHFTADSYTHSYVSASYQGTEYIFSSPINQTQSWVWTDTYSETLGGLLYWNSYSATQSP